MNLYSKVMSLACSKYNRKRISCVGRDYALGITTRYGLEGPGIESRWERDFPQNSRPVLGPTQPRTQWVPVLFLGGKADGAWC